MSTSRQPEFDNATRTSAHRRRPLAPKPPTHQNQLRNSLTITVISANNDTVTAQPAIIRYTSMNPAINGLCYLPLSVRLQMTQDMGKRHRSLFLAEVGAALGLKSEGCGTRGEVSDLEFFIPRDEAGLDGARKRSSVRAASVTLVDELERLSLHPEEQEAGLFGLGTFTVYCMFTSHSEKNIDKDVPSPRSTTTPNLPQHHHYHEVKRESNHEYHEVEREANYDTLPAKINIRLLCPPALQPLIPDFPPTGKLLFTTTISPTDTVAGMATRILDTVHVPARTKNRGGGAGAGGSLVGSVKLEYKSSEVTDDGVFGVREVFENMRWSSPKGRLVEFVAYVDVDVVKDEME